MVLLVIRRLLGDSAFVMHLETGIDQFCTICTQIRKEVLISVHISFCAHIGIYMQLEHLA